MEYVTLKLCSYRKGGANRLAPAGQIIDIDDEAVAKALTDLGAIKPYNEADAPAKSDDPGNMTGDTFAAWLAGGAKVGQVIDWIGDDLARAEIAMADGRKGVQKHIAALLDTPDDAEPEEAEEAAEEAADDAAEGEDAEGDE